MKKLIAALFLAMVSTSALAGVNVGIDAGSKATGISVGYGFNKYLGAEVSYTKVKGDTAYTPCTRPLNQGCGATSFNTNQSVTAGALVATLPLSESFGVIGKVGIANVSGNGVMGTGNRVNGAYYAYGVKYDINSAFTVRLVQTKPTTSDVKGPGSYTTLGLVYNF